MTETPASQAEYRDSDKDLVYVASRFNRPFVPEKKTDPVSGIEGSKAAVSASGGSDKQDGTEARAESATANVDNEANPVPENMTPSPKWQAQGSTSSSKKMSETK